MMADVLALLLKWWALGAVAILGVGVALFLVGKMLAKIRAFRKAGPAVVVVAVCAIIYGGSKNITGRFTADEGITVTAALLFVPTNETDEATLAISGTGGISIGGSVSGRNSVHDQWAPIDIDGWMVSGYETDGVTDTVFYAVSPGPAASNVTVWARWHYGTDLPPVEIDGEGVTIEEFLATSKAVTVRYAVNPSALGNSGGAVSIEKQGTDNVWVELYRLSIAQPVTNTVTFPGFWVGERTRWRVRLEVNQ